MPDTPYTIPEGGSLGLLAYGHIGLERWREVRGTAWKDAQREAVETARTAAPGPTLSPDMLLTVVTGLPRSGTSMAMQMLVAGGLPAFTDGQREADESNPRGYYEHDRVRSLATDPDWVPDADGHAVKVVAPLAVHLPQGARYDVILMERDVDEVLRSQSAMLGRSGEASADAQVLRPAYQRFLDETLAWAERTPGVRLLRVRHAAAIESPADVAAQLADFCSAPDPLDAHAMASAVDPSLYRERTS